MRKITELAAAAFETGREFKQSNTEVKLTQEGKCVELLLFNNRIAYKHLDSNHFYITNAGWKSPTTKERLNGLQGVSIQ